MLSVMLLIGGLSAAPAFAASNLHDAVLQAVTENPEVLAKWNALRAARHEKKAAKGANYPRLDLSGRVGYNKQNNDIRDQNFRPREASLELTQLLFDGFATRNNIRKFDHISLTRYFELLEMSENIALETTRAYLDVLKYRKLLTLATENYSQHLTIYTQVEERVTAGVGRGVDLQQASGRLALAESNRITEATNLHDVSARYLRIVGEPPALSLDDPGQIAPALPTKTLDLFRKAFAQNPSFSAAMENLKASEYDREQRKGANWPRLELRARQDVGFDRSSISGNSDESTVEMVMNYNLFRGNTDAETNRQFADRREVAREQKNKVCRDIRQTLDIAFNDVQRLELQLKQLDLHQQAIANAREAYRKQFDIGQRSLLDLLDTENEYFQARRAYAAALFDYQQARARTEAGMGNLLTSLNVQQDAYSPQEPLDGLRADAIDPDAICPPLGIPLSGLEEISFTPPPAPQLERTPVQTPAVLPQVEDILIFFGRWKIDITEQESGKISEIAKYLMDHPDSMVQLSGHASSRGRIGINVALSRDRARAVRDRLVENFNINPSRIEVVWYSSLHPLSDNGTEEGKAKNRRVVAHFAKAQK